MGFNSAFEGLILPIYSTGTGHMKSTVLKTVNSGVPSSVHLRLAKDGQTCAV